MPTMRATNKPTTMGSAWPVSLEAAASIGVAANSVAVDSSSFVDAGDETAAGVRVAERVGASGTAAMGR
jgi:hypothetical protein